MQECTKRLAKEVFMLRYIPEYRVYEMSITWHSEKRTSPTIVYLSEIFIHPFCAPAQTVTETPPTPPVDREIVKAEPVCDKKPPIILKPPNILPDNLKQETPIMQTQKKAEGLMLNYDLLINRVKMMNIAIERNKEVVKHNIFKDAPKKKRKT